MTVTGLIFMMAFFVGIGLALFRHPIYGLYTYIAVFYLHPPSRWWGVFLPDLRWSFLAAGLTLVAIWWRHPPGRVATQPWYATTPAKYLIVFTIWLTIQSLWALDVDQHYSVTALFAKYIVVYYLIYRLVDTPGKMLAFLAVHVAGSFYLGYLGFSAHGSDRLDGVGGPGIDDSNTLGMHLATAATAAAMLILYLRGWRQWLVILAMAFILDTIVLTGSRGAFLALVLGGMVLPYLKPAAHKRLFWVFAVLGVVLFSYVASETFWNRMDTMTAAVDDQKEMDSSAESRIVMLKAQAEMAMHYPFGNGHRGTEVLSAKYLDAKWLTAGGARSSHNTFATVVVEHGIPGTIMFFGMFFWTASVVRRLKRRLTAAPDAVTSVNLAAVASGIVVVFIGGMFADFLAVEVQVWLFALLASLMHTVFGPQSQEAGVARAPAVAPVRAVWANRSNRWG